MLPQSEFENSIRKTVLLYNKLRSPGVVVKLVGITPVTLTISFSGSFCYSCGVPIELIKDFVKDLKIFSTQVDLEIGKTRETTPGSFEVDFKIRLR